MGVDGYDEAAIEDAVAELRADFAREFPSLVRELRAALDGGDDQVKMARVLAHRIFGTAGSYGFDRASAAAGELETLLLQWLERPDPTTGLMAVVEKPLAILIEEGAAVAKEGAST